MLASVSRIPADDLLIGFFLSEPQSYDFVGLVFVRNLQDQPCL